MPEKTGSLVCRVYVISDDGEEQIVKETTDERCITAVLNWCVAHQNEYRDENKS